MIARRKPIPKKRATPRTKRCVACSARGTTPVCPECKTRRTSKRTSIKARCDRMASQIVKIRAGDHCESCGKIANLDWAHGWPRRHHNLRWETKAAFGLCRPCHVWYTAHPLAWSDWLVNRLGRQTAEYFERAANEPWDRDYGRVIAELTAALKEARSNRQ